MAGIGTDGSPQPPGRRNAADQVAQSDSAEEPRLTPDRAAGQHGARPVSDLVALGACVVLLHRRLNQPLSVEPLLAVGIRVGVEVRALGVEEEDRRLRPSTRNPLPDETLVKHEGACRDTL